MHLCLPTEEINGAFTVFTQEPSLLFFGLQIVFGFHISPILTWIRFLSRHRFGFVRLFFLSPLVPSAFPGELDLTRFCLLLDRTGRKSERDNGREKRN